MPSLLQSKRKAEDDLDKRHGVSNLQPANPRRVAEDASIYSIIRRNPRTPLYVEPILWTSDQLQCLNCSFSRENLRKKAHGVAHDPLSPHIQDVATDKPGSQLSRVSTRVKNQLAQVSVLNAKKFAIQDLLEAYGIHPQRSECLSFQFSHQAVAQLPTDGIFTSSAAPFNVAFITFDTIKSLRESYVQLKRAKNVSVLKIRRKKLRLIEPPDRAEDPYLVAVLIALAQGQRRQLQQNSRNVNIATDDAWASAGRQPCPDMGRVLSEARSFKVKVLAISGVVARSLYVYTATIPAEFLDKFDEPLRYSPTCPITISYYRIAVREGRSLERLRGLLCADIHTLQVPTHYSEAD